MPFFPRKLAQLWHDRSEQLNDDRRADVGHDAQRSDCTILKPAAREQAVHVHERIAVPAAAAREVINQRSIVQSWSWNQRRQPADSKNNQGEEYSRFKLGNLEAVREGIGDRVEHGSK